MGKSMIQLVVTGMSNRSAEEMETNCNPQLWNEFQFLVSTMLGEEIKIQIENVDIVDAEDFDDSIL